mgnify:CR=1 FL=1
MSLINCTIIDNNNQTNRITKKRFKHLTSIDRENIEYYYSKGYNQSQIAREIGVHRSTISREIKKGLWNYKTNASGRHYKYQYDVAQTETKRRRNNSKQKPLLNEQSSFIVNIKNIVINYQVSLYQAVSILDDNWDKSKEVLETVSVTTLYKYAYKNILDIKRKYLPYGLRSKKDKTPKQGKRVQRGENIAKRPKEAEKRLEFAHWEADLVVGPLNGAKDCLFTLADRKTRTYLAFKIPNKSAASVISVLDSLEKQLGQETFMKYFATITFDNGSEFSKVDEMKASIFDKTIERFKVYFANAYHSWERGTNEVGNRWLRRFFPKGTDFSNVTTSEVTEALQKINYTNRKLFHNKSSAKLLEDMNINLLEILNIVNPFTNYTPIYLNY